MLVGWSYAGRVISDYVTNRNTDGISGVDFVDASIKFVPEFVGDNLKNLPLFIVIPLIRADLQKFDAEYSLLTCAVHQVRPLRRNLT